MSQCPYKFDINVITGKDKDRPNMGIKLRENTVMHA